MIFVTVGTHEQQFDRLIKKIDELVKSGVINEQVFIQTGYSTYKPKYCDFSQFLSYEHMIKNVVNSNIIITHGGPGSIMLALSYQKIPIVVPRQKEFNEHVDNHQVLFTKRLTNENKIIAIYDINDIRNALINYEILIESKTISAKNNTTNFIDKMNKLTEKLFNESR
jgi:UDP-N-acetylglucosamine transferase subunit ALG13